MLLFLVKALVCAVLVPFNFYGAALLFYQSHLLKKLGQLLLLLVLPILLHLVLRLLAAPYASVPFLSVGLLFLLLLAGLPSKEATKPLVSSAVSFRFSQEQLKGSALFFTLVFPAFVSIVQVLTLFK
jgi:hypothetical protein